MPPQLFVAFNSYEPTDAVAKTFNPIEEPAVCVVKLNPVAAVVEFANVTLQVTGFAAAEVLIPNKSYV